MPILLKLPAIFLLLVCHCLVAGMCSSFWIVPGAWAQRPPESTGTTVPGRQGQQDVAAGENEPEDQMEVSEQIRIHISPLHHGRIIDKITDDAVITIHAPEGKFVEVYAQPIDAPYGGLPVEEPDLIGTRMKLIAGSAKIAWPGPNPHRYYRIFAVVFKSSSNAELPTRSAFVSVGIAGKRLCEGVSSVK